MTTPTNSVKQRKLSDLRVVDLQRELRSFSILYDKKELKLSLVEKLRQALINRNLDPDTHLFDIATDLKSLSSDENNRSHDENGSHELNILETSNMEIDSDHRLNIENSVQTIATSPTTKNSTTPSSSINDLDDDQNDQTNRMDTIDLRQIVEERDNDNIFLTIDQSTTKSEDENNNDKIDHGLIQVSCSSSDDELDTNKKLSQSTNLNNNNNRFNHNTKLSTATEQQTSFDHKHGEDEKQATDLSNDNITKSEINRQESSEEQQKKEITNKDQCHLWVSNIAKETHALDLQALFSKYGKVLTTKVIGSSSSQWFGYINLATPDDVEKCINALHKTELHGKKIHVDREMHDSPPRSSSSKSKTNSSSTSSNRHISSRESSSNTHRKRSDHSSHKSSSNDLSRKRNLITDIQDKSSSADINVLSKKRSIPRSDENKKRLSTSDITKSNNDEKIVKTHEDDSSIKKSNDTIIEKRRNSSSSSNSQSSKHHTSRTDAPKTSEKTESSRSAHKSTINDKSSIRSDKPSIQSTDISKVQTSSPASHRSQSSEKRSISSSTKSDHKRSSSIDKSKQRISSHTVPNKYEKPKEPFVKDTHRSTVSNTFENDRRSIYQNEQRLRHEKELLVRKQFVQQQEEEKIKEQQRRLAEERERMRREFEMLERERSEIERTRQVLEKEKQDQARELEKQQRRLADEAKHRQQQVEAKLRDEKLHRLSNNDNKRPRSSQHEPQRSHRSNTNNNNNNNSSSNLNKGYDNRSSTSGHGRERSLGETNRDYYPQPKRQYTNNTNHPREASFRDRVVYRDSDVSTSASNLGSSSSMSSSNNSQRYIPSSSNQHRLSDPYNNLPQRGRDMALPPTSSVSTVYERSSRNTGSPPINNNSILRRPSSRERFDDRDYMQQGQRRDRSPPTSNTMRREPMETTHWERPKPRETGHYADEIPKYLPTRYLPESSQSAQQQQQQQQQQGLWSSAPPSRQQHHHPDLSVKNAPHAPVVDPYGWQHVSQQVPPQPPPSHHPQGLSASHDRSRVNIPSNQRIPILPSNQQPPPPPPSSRGNATGQTHLYSHPGVPVGALPSSQQQHAPLAPPPPSLHHATAYVTQQAPPTGLVLHPAGQTRAYEQHYVVTQSLQQRRY